MGYAVAGRGETEEGGGRVELSRFERSPRLSELKVAYRSRTKFRERWTIRNAGDVVGYLRAVWNKHTLELVEEFLVLCLNGNHQVMGWVKVASGGFTSTAIDPRVIFGIALQTASTAIVVAHNHPSGCVLPSVEDQRVTDRLKDAGRTLGIAVLDHIILTKDSAFSFAEGRAISGE
jgi:DNA repair protein RadC